MRKRQFATNPMLRGTISISKHLLYNHFVFRILRIQVVTRLVQGTQITAHIKNTCKYKSFGNAQLQESAVKPFQNCSGQLQRSSHPQFCSDGCHFAFAFI